MTGIYGRHKVTTIRLLHTPQTLPTPSPHRQPLLRHRNTAMMFESAYTMSPPQIHSCGAYSRTALLLAAVSTHACVCAGFANHMSCGIECSLHDPAAADINMNFNAASHVL